MKLTTKIIEKSTTQAKPYRLTDGKGMYLLVTKSGSKLWRLDYTLNKKRNTHALGIFLDITLQESRDRCSDAKKLINDGKDEEILEKRVQLYTQKKEENPSRWSGETRNWDVVGSVSLNPDRIGEAA